MPVRIDDIQEIYTQFRIAQAEYKNRPYRLPKDFEKHFTVKMSEQNKKKLIKITGFFKTKWSNIDPYEYFSCGFELEEGKFTYAKFFKPNVLKLYIVKDKNKKRKAELTKRGLIDSAKFVKSYMKKNHVDSIQEYINISEGNHKLVVDHYLKNRIDAAFFVYLIRKKGLKLTDTERGLIPYIQQNYRRIISELDEMKNFLNKLGEKL